MADRPYNQIRVSGESDLAGACDRNFDLIKKAIDGIASKLQIVAIANQPVAPVDPSITHDNSGPTANFSDDDSRASLIIPPLDVKLQPGTNVSITGTKNRPVINSNSPIPNDRRVPPVMFTDDEPFHCSCVPRDDVKLQAGTNVTLTGNKLRPVINASSPIPNDRRLPPVMFTDEVDDGHIHVCIPASDVKLQAGTNVSITGNRNRPIINSSSPIPNDRRLRQVFFTDEPEERHKCIPPGDLKIQAGTNVTLSGTRSRPIINATLQPVYQEMFFSFGHGPAIGTDDKLPINSEGDSSFMLMPWTHGGTATTTTGAGNAAFQMPGEWPVIGGPFTKFQIDMYIYESVINGAGALAQLFVTADSGISWPPTLTGTLFLAFPSALHAGGTPNYQTSSVVALSSPLSQGHTVGVKFDINNNVTSGLAHFFVRLRLIP